MASNRAAARKLGQVSSPALDAAAAATWRLGDRTVNQLGFGVMRLTGSLPFGRGAPSDGLQSLEVLQMEGDLAIAPVVSVQNLPGTGSPAHLEGNLTAASLCLDVEDLARLDAAS
jgi:hypothetical protein